MWVCQWLWLEPRLDLPWGLEVPRFQEHDDNEVYRSSKARGSGCNTATDVGSPCLPFRPPSGKALLVSPSGNPPPHTHAYTQPSEHPSPCPQIHCSLIPYYPAQASLHGPL